MDSEGFLDWWEEWGREWDVNSQVAEGGLAGLAGLADERRRDCISRGGLERARVGCEIDRGGLGGERLGVGIGRVE